MSCIFGAFCAPDNKNFAISVTLVIFTCSQTPSLSLESVAFQFWPEQDPQLYGHILNLGKPQKPGVSVTGDQQNCYDFSFCCHLHRKAYSLLHKEFLLLSLEQPNFRNFIIFGTGQFFIIVGCVFGCCCYEFNTINFIVNFLQHCWWCVKCTECTKIGVYSFFSHLRGEFRSGEACCRRPSYFYFFFRTSAMRTVI